MATGIPTAKKKIASDTTRTVALNYPNKRAVLDILSTTPGRFKVLQGNCPDKRLYFADNLSVLAALAEDSNVAGKVRLIYIDPPYATQTSFQTRDLSHAYIDVFGVAEYLEFIRERVVFLHNLLAIDGSIYLHIDDKMMFHVKIILDEVFGPSNYRACITRKKCNPKNYTSKTFGNVADYLLFYSKSETYVWNKQSEPWTKERSAEYQYVDEKSGRLHMRVPVHAPGIRNGDTGKPWRDKLPPAGKHWQFSPAKLDALDAAGEIHWSKNGNPRRKVYLDSSDGVAVQDIWLEFKDAHNQNICITGYPTEKNPDLIRRVVKASSNPGDLVLDCFAGSGTTLVVADELNRKWIGVDNSTEAIRTILNRFTNGSLPMGDFVTPPVQKIQTSMFGFDQTDRLEVSQSTQLVADFMLLAEEVALECSDEQPTCSHDKY